MDSFRRYLYLFIKLYLYHNDDKLYYIYIIMMNNLNLFIYTLHLTVLLKIALNDCSIRVYL